MSNVSTTPSELLRDSATNFASSEELAETAAIQLRTAFGELKSGVLPTSWAQYNTLRAEWLSAYKDNPDSPSDDAATRAFQRLVFRAYGVPLSQCRPAAPRSKLPDADPAKQAAKQAAKAAKEAEKAARGQLASLARELPIEAVVATIEAAKRPSAKPEAAKPEAAKPEAVRVAEALSFKAALEAALAAGDCPAAKRATIKKWLATQ